MTSLVHSRAGARFRPRRQSLARRLRRFVWERFPPLTYGFLIAAFVSCGYVGSALAADTGLRLDGSVLLIAAVVGLVFLRMRLVDELKDAHVDQLGRPDRPLPRGLVTEGELRTAAVGCGLLELACASVLGPLALFAFAPAFVFSLLAAWDFWTGPVVHRNLLVYALVHSPITPLLLCFVWFAHPAAGAGPALFSLILLVWGVALGLEIARKTVSTAEERPFVETYSAALGVGRATGVAAIALGAAAIGAASFAAAVGASGLLAGAPLVAALALLAGVTLGIYQALTLRATASLFGAALLAWPALLLVVERSAA